MVRSLFGVGLVVLQAGCSMEVDVSQLIFAPAEVATMPDASGYGPIECNEYVHCILGDDGAPGNSNACLEAISDSSYDAAMDLEECRVQRCGNQEFQSGADKAGLAVKCLLEECTEETVSCVAGRGESTCLSYAVKWQSQAAGTTECPQVPREMCLVDYLVKVRTQDLDSVTKLIKCISELPRGAVEELPKCLSLCD